MKSAMPGGLWPVDWMILGYLLATGAVIGAFYQEIPDSLALLAAHAIGMTVIIGYVVRPEWPGARLFRHWYPLPYVGACYREMSIIIIHLRQVSFDAQLAAWDRAIWGVHPTVWMERIQSAGFTEFLQIAYSLFVPCVIGVALIFWLRGEMNEFRSYAFLLAMGFLVSYVGYFIVPARGPRYYLAALQLTPLTGWWLAGPLRTTLDVLESAHYDCFPSGHVEMTVLAWWTVRRISAKLGWVYAAYTVSILLATVYLRYHYTIDLIAGIAVAAAVLAAAPYLEERYYRGPTRNCAGRR